MSVNDKEKIMPSPQEIEKMYEKIQQNKREDEHFSAQVDKFIKGKMKNYETLSLGNTPNVLYLVGANADELTIKQNVLKNSMLDESQRANRHFSGHNIPAEIIKKLPEHLRNPILILEGQHPNTVVAVTELKNMDDKSIIVPIALDLKGVNGIVNKVTTIYGKDNINKYLTNHQNQILAYNREKTDKLHKDIGLQLPKLNTVICFDNSIAYSTSNVKIPDKKIAEKTVEKNPSGHESLRSDHVPPEKKKTPFSKAKLLETAAKLKRDRQENPPQNKSKKRNHDIDL